VCPKWYLGNSSYFTSLLYDIHYISYLATYMLEFGLKLEFCKVSKAEWHNIQKGKFSGLE